MTPALEILTLFDIIKSRSVLLCGVTRVGSSMSCFSESEEQRSLILDDSAYGHDHIKVVKYWTLEKWQKNKFGDNFFISNAIKVKFRENKSGSKCNTKFS